MKEWGIEDDRFQSVSKFEEMLGKNKQLYFDIEEFEDIIDFYIDNNNLSHANKAIDIAMLQHPISDSIQLRQAVVHIQNINASQAISILEKLIKVNPNQYETIIAYSSALLLQGKDKLAEVYLKKAFEINLEESAGFLYHNGLNYLTSGRYDYAIKFLLISYNYDKNNYYALNDIAFCYERLNDYKKSINYYNKYLDQDPFDEIIWYNLGIVYERAGKTESALEAYDFTITINQKYDLAFYSKANLLISLGRYYEAIELFHELAEIAEEKADIYCLIGECYEKAEEYTNAHKYYKKSLEEDKTYSDSWFGIAMVKSAKEEYFESLYYLRMAISFDDSNEEYFLELGKINQKLGFLDDADKNFNKAIEIAPYDDELWSFYAEMYIKQTNYDKALRILYEAKSNISDSSNILYKISVCEIFTGNYNAGFKFFEKALKIDYKLHKEYLEKFSELKLYKEVSELIQTYKNTHN